MEQPRSDIFDGSMIADMALKTMYNIHGGAYHCFLFQRFKAKLKIMREAIKKNLEEVRDNKATLFNTLQNTVIAAIQPYLEWNHSTTQTLLV